MIDARPGLIEVTNGGRARTVEISGASRRITTRTPPGPGIVDILYFSLNAVADPPQLRVVVTGELDVLSASGLRGAVQRRTKDGCSSVVVDLDGVTFIDCTGLSALLACQQEVAASGGTFSLGALSGAVARVIELTGVAGRFDSAAAQPA
jgi:anti-sigma B factor antagonist